MSQPNATAPSPQRHAGAIIAAWLLPGLGHVLIGKRGHGLVIMGAIVGLYVAGLLIGGISVIDSRQSRLWYYGQLIAGPATIGVDYLHQAKRAEGMKRIGQTTFTGTLPGRDEVFGYTASIGRVHELGTLYCTMAGLLNLLVIVDVMFRVGAEKPPTSQKPTRGRVVTRKGVTS